jgi:predicted ATPase
MKKIVFTGGPFSGKSKIASRLRGYFGDQTVFVPETAMLLLEGGFPKPCDILPWSPEWHLAFEDAIFQLQKSIEQASSLLATHNNCKLMILDRGLLDIAGHLPGGMDQFCDRYNVTEEHCLGQYDIVIHLVSIAAIDTVTFQKIARARWKEKTPLTSLEYCLQIEEATLAAYANHKNRFVVHGQGNMESKMTEVVKIVKEAMQSS